MTVSANVRIVLDKAAAFLSVVLFYVFLHVAGIGCPIRFFTGISCPGCGMTRAYIELLHFDPAHATFFHPLWPLPMIFVLLYVLRAYLKRNGITVRHEDAIIKAYAFANYAAFLTVYIVRMLYLRSDPVVFAPYDGAIFKALSILRSLILR
ncbi:MAG: DUF2752 domain-containing protein [Lachnospiraceae bacterium]|nr:DUF2752 domain-containing protein [Lachnospiraceae bacterium]